MAIVLVCVWLATQIDKRAGFLLAPSLAWAIFAVISTARIFAETIRDAAGSQPEVEVF